jgi:HD-like signal output (HDOD) protein
MSANAGSSPSDPVLELGAALADIVARGDFAVPPYPAVALRLQRTLARRNHSLGEVADALSADPALAARVLSVANSPLYRGTSDITTVARAVNRLGTRTVASIALAAGIGATAMQAGVLFDVKYRVWRRSVTCALACQKLAQLRMLDPEQGFLTGLLHGFGRSLAVAALEQRLAAQRPPRPLSVSEWLSIAEQQRGKLASVMARRWELPAAIASAMDEHAEVSPMGMLVSEADRLALLLETGERPAGASAAETRVLDQLISGLPEALDALAAAPALAPTQGGAVAKAEQTRPEELRRVPLQVTDCRKRHPASVRCAGVSPSGLMLESSLPFQEGSLVRLAIGAREDAFEPWFNVLTCVPAGAKQQVEVELFSPTRETRERWQRVLEQPSA